MVLSRARSAASSAASRARSAASSAASTVSSNVSSPGSRGETSSSVSSGTTGDDGSGSTGSGPSGGSGGGGAQDGDFSDDGVRNIGGSSGGGGSRNGGSGGTSSEDISERISDIGSDISSTVSETLSFGSDSSETDAETDVDAETDTDTDVDIPESTERELRTQAAEDNPAISSSDVEVTDFEIGDRPETASEVEDISPTQRAEARQQAAEDSELFGPDDFAVTGVEDTDEGRRLELEAPEVSADFEVRGDSDGVQTQRFADAPSGTATGAGGPQDLDIAGQNVDSVTVDEQRVSDSGDPGGLTVGDTQLIGPGDDLPSSASEIREIDLGRDELVSSDIPSTDFGRQRSISGSAREAVGLDFDPVSEGRATRDDLFDALDPRDVDRETAGTAAAAGAAVAVPEPTSSASGVATLGAIGLGVGGAAIASQSEIRTPESRDEFDTSELGLPSGTELTQTTAEIDIDDADRVANGLSGRSELDAPTRREDILGVGGAELSVPEQTDQAELGLPQIEAQQLAGRGEFEEGQELEDLLDPEQAERLRRRERGETARQAFEQQIFEQEQEFGEIERETLPERDRFEGVIIDDIGSGIAGRGEPETFGERDETFGERFDRMIEERQEQQQQQFVDQDPFVFPDGQAPDLSQSVATDQSSLLDSSLDFEFASDGIGGSGFDPASGPVFSDGADAGLDRPTPGVDAFSPGVLLGETAQETTAEADLGLGTGTAAVGGVEELQEIELDQQFPFSETTANQTAAETTAEPVTEPLAEPVAEPGLAEPTLSETQTAPRSQTRTLSARRPPIPGFDSDDEEERERDMVGMEDAVLEVDVPDLADVDRDIAGGPNGS